MLFLLRYVTSLARALHSQLQPSTVPQWLPLQSKNAKILLLDILHEPEKHIEHTRRQVCIPFIGTVVCLTCNDVQIRSQSDHDYDIRQDYSDLLH